MNIDTHVHLLLTKDSSPSWREIKLVAEVARAKGIDALCITEHLDARYYEQLVKGIFFEKRLGGQIVSPGICVLDNGLILTSAAEVSIKGGGDIGVHTDPDTLLSLDKEKGIYSLDSLCNVLTARNQPYVLVVHHIYRPGKWVSLSDEQVEKIDALELPAKDVNLLDKYRCYRIVLDIPSVTGSDSHTWAQIGAGYTNFPNKENSNGEVSLTFSELKQMISLHQGVSTYSPEAEKIVKASQLYRSFLKESSVPAN